MIQSKIARRYAKALFDLSFEQSILEEIYQDLQSLDKIIKSSLDLQVFLTDPLIFPSKQKEIIQNLFHQKIHPNLYQFLFFLINKNRLNILDDVFLSFDVLYLEHKALARAKIISIISMEKEQLNRLSLKLESIIKKKIIPQEIIDPKILGGFKVQLDDLVFDDSFATQLEHFHSNLINKG